MNLATPRPLVILLSGASSSGKTTLAEALQRRLRTPAILVEADRTFPGVPADHPHWASIGRPHPDVVLAHHRSIASWAEDGFHLIVDGSLPYEDRQLRAACIQVFTPYDLRILGVRCSAAELARRERGRPEVRPRGWAVQQSKDIHERMDYAAQVDTTTRSAEDCAEDAAAQLGLPLLER